MMRLTGRTFLITGGGSGLGFALAESLIQKGNTVIAVGRSDARLAAARAQQPKLTTRVADVGTKEGVTELAHWVETEHPNVDVLVNNAGVYNNLDLLSGASTEPLEREVELNFLGPIRLSLALLPLLRRQPEAAIINITSASIYVPVADAPTYGATKAALHLFTETLRYQVRNTDIKVVEVVPPAVDSEMSAGRFSGQSRLAQPIRANAYANAVLSGLARDTPVIRVGMARLFYHAARLFPDSVRKQALSTPSARTT